MSRAVFVIAALPTVGWATSVTVFSGSGFVVPETITQIPLGFGTLGGNYFVPDSVAAELEVLPASGGNPTPFASIPGNMIAGVFVPAGYGALSGSFLVSGNGSAAVVSSSGVVTSLSPSYGPEGVTVAPAAFGALGGKVLLGNFESDGTADVLELNPDATTSVFATIGSGQQAFGMSFAPAGFGSIGGDLLVSDGSSGNLYAVDASGNVSVFATLPIPVVADETTGLRQLAFAPSGFGSYGGDLFVSVSGSQQGGGSLGSVDILNSSGLLIADLLQGTVGVPYDPRGLDFVSNDQLLVADTDPGILSVPPAAFTATTPEPASITLSLLGLTGMFIIKSKVWHAR